MYSNTQAPKKEKKKKKKQSDSDSKFDPDSEREDGETKRKDSKKKKRSEASNVSHEEDEGSDTKKKRRSNASKVSHEGDAGSDTKKKKRSNASTVSHQEDAGSDSKKKRRSNASKVNHEEDAGSDGESTHPRSSILKKSSVKQDHDSQNSDRSSPDIVEDDGEHVEGTDKVRTLPQGVVSVSQDGSVQSLVVARVARVDASLLEAEETSHLSTPNWAMPKARANVYTMDSYGNEAMTALPHKLISMDCNTLSAAVEQFSHLPMESVHHFALNGESVHAFYKDKKLVDLLIHVEDRNFIAHRLIMCTHSKFFCDILFNNDIPPYTVTDVTLKGIDPDIFKRFVHFAYTGNLFINVNHLWRLNVLAKQLDSDTMKIKLNSFMTKFNTMPLESALRLLTESDTPDPFETALALDVVKSHFSCVLNRTDRFAMFQFNDLKDLLSMDDLSIDSELDIFWAVLFWLAYDPIQRIRYLEELMGLVRFTTMSSLELMDCARASEMVQLSKPVKEMVIKASWVSHVREVGLEDPLNMPEQKKRGCILSKGAKPPTVADFDLRYLRYKNMMKRLGDDLELVPIYLRPPQGRQSHLSFNENPHYKPQSMKRATLGSRSSGFDGDSNTGDGVRKKSKPRSSVSSADTHGGNKHGKKKGSSASNMSGNEDRHSSDGSRKRSKPRSLADPNAENKHGRKKESSIPIIYKDEESNEDDSNVKKSRSRSSASEEAGKKNKKKNTGARSETSRDEDNEEENDEGSAGKKKKKKKEGKKKKSSTKAGGDEESNISENKSVSRWSWVNDKTFPLSTHPESTQASDEDSDYFLPRKRPHGPRDEPLNEPLDGHRDSQAKTDSVSKVDRSMSITPPDHASHILAHDSENTQIDDGTNLSDIPSSPQDRINIRSAPTRLEGRPKESVDAEFNINESKRVVFLCTDDSQGDVSSSVFRDDPFPVHTSDKLKSIQEASLEDSMGQHMGGSDALFLWESSLRELTEPLLLHDDMLLPELSHKTEEQAGLIDGTGSSVWSDCSSVDGTFHVKFNSCSNVRADQPSVEANGSSAMTDNSNGEALSFNVWADCDSVEIDEGVKCFSAGDTGSGFNVSADCSCKQGSNVGVDCPSKEAIHSTEESKYFTAERCSSKVWADISDVPAVWSNSEVRLHSSIEAVGSKVGTNYSCIDTVGSNVDGKYSSVEAVGSNIEVTCSNAEDIGLNVLAGVSDMEDVDMTLHTVETRGSNVATVDSSNRQEDGLEVEAAVLDSNTRSSIVVGNTLMVGGVNMDLGPMPSSERNLQTTQLHPTLSDGDFDTFPNTIFQDSPFDAFSCENEACIKTTLLEKPKGKKRIEKHPERTFTRRMKESPKRSDVCCPEENDDEITVSPSVDSVLFKTARCFTSADELDNDWSSQTLANVNELPRDRVAPPTNESVSSNIHSVSSESLLTKTPTLSSPSLSENTTQVLLPSMSENIPRLSPTYLLNKTKRRDETKRKSRTVTLRGSDKCTSRQGRVSSRAQTDRQTTADIPDDLFWDEMFLFRRSSTLTNARKFEVAEKPFEVQPRLGASKRPTEKDEAFQDAHKAHVESSQCEQSQSGYGGFEVPSSNGGGQEYFSDHFFDCVEDADMFGPNGEGFSNRNQTFTYVDIDSDFQQSMSEGFQSKDRETTIVDEKEPPVAQQHRQAGVFDSTRHDKTSEGTTQTGREGSQVDPWGLAVDQLRTTTNSVVKSSATTRLAAHDARVSREKVQPEIDLEETGIVPPQSLRATGYCSAEDEQNSELQDHLDLHRPSFHSTHFASDKDPKVQELSGEGGNGLSETDWCGDSPRMSIGSKDTTNGQRTTSPHMSNRSSNYKSSDQRIASLHICRASDCGGPACKDDDQESLRFSPVSNKTFKATPKQAELLRIDGPKQAELLRIDGPKQAELLRIDGPKQAEFLRIDGPKQAELLRIDKLKQPKMLRIDRSSPKHAGSTQVDSPKHLQYSLSSSGWETVSFKSTTSATDNFSSLKSEMPPSVSLECITPQKEKPSPTVKSAKKLGPFTRSRMDTPSHSKSEEVQCAQVERDFTVTKRQESMSLSKGRGRKQLPMGPESSPDSSSTENVETRPNTMYKPAVLSSSTETPREHCGAMLGPENDAVAVQMRQSQHLPLKSTSKPGKGSTEIRPKSGRYPRVQKVPTSRQSRDTSSKLILTHKSKPGQGHGHVPQSCSRSAIDLFTGQKFQTCSYTLSKGGPHDTIERIHDEKTSMTSASEEIHTDSPALSSQCEDTHWSCLEPDEHSRLQALVPECDSRLQQRQSRLIAGYMPQPQIKDSIDQSEYFSPHTDTTKYHTGASEGFSSGQVSRERGETADSVSGTNVQDVNSSRVRDNALKSKDVFGETTPGSSDDKTVSGDIVNVRLGEVFEIKTDDPLSLGVVNEMVDNKQNIEMSETFFSASQKHDFGVETDDTIRQSFPGEIHETGPIRGGNQTIHDSNTTRTQVMGLDSEPIGVVTPSVGGGVVEEGQSKRDKKSVADSTIVWQNILSLDYESDDIEVSPIRGRVVQAGDSKGDSKSIADSIIVCQHIMRPDDETIDVGVRNRMIETEESKGEYPNILESTTGRQITSLDSLLVEEVASIAMGEVTNTRGIIEESKSVSVVMTDEARENGLREEGASTTRLPFADERTTTEQRDGSDKSVYTCSSEKRDTCLDHSEPKAFDGVKETRHTTEGSKYVSVGNSEDVQTSDLKQEDEIIRCPHSDEKWASEQRCGSEKSVNSTGRQDSRIDHEVPIALSGNTETGYSIEESRYVSVVVAEVIQASHFKQEDAAGLRVTSEKTTTEQESGSDKSLDSTGKQFSCFHSDVVEVAAPMPLAEVTKIGQTRPTCIGDEKRDSTVSVQHLQDSDLDPHDASRLPTTHDQIADGQRVGSIASLEGSRLLSCVDIEKVLSSSIQQKETASVQRVETTQRIDSAIEPQDFGIEEEGIVSLPFKSGEASEEHRVSKSEGKPSVLPSNVLKREDAAMSVPVKLSGAITTGERVQSCKSKDTSRADQDVELKQVDAMNLPLIEEHSRTEKRVRSSVSVGCTRVLPDAELRQQEAMSLPIMYEDVTADQSLKRDKSGQTTRSTEPPEVHIERNESRRGNVPLKSGYTAQSLRSETKESVGCLTHAGISTERNKVGHIMSPLKSVDSGQRIRVEQRVYSTRSTLHSCIDLERDETRPLSSPLDLKSEVTEQRIRDEQTEHRVKSTSHPDVDLEPDETRPLSSPLDLKSEVTEQRIRDEQTEHRVTSTSHPDVDLERDETRPLSSQLKSEDKGRRIISDKAEQSRSIESTSHQIIGLEWDETGLTMLPLKSEDTEQRDRSEHSVGSTRSIVHPDIHRELGETRFVSQPSTRKESAHRLRSEQSVQRAKSTTHPEIHTELEETRFVSPPSKFKESAHRLRSEESGHRLRNEESGHRLRSEESGHRLRATVQPEIHTELEEVKFVSQPSKAEDTEQREKIDKVVESAKGQLLKREDTEQRQKSDKAVESDEGQLLKGEDTEQRQSSDTITEGAKGQLLKSSENEQSQRSDIVVESAKGQLLKREDTETSQKSDQSVEGAKAHPANDAEEATSYVTVPIQEEMTQTDHPEAEVDSVQRPPPQWGQVDGHSHSQAMSYSYPPSSLLEVVASDIVNLLITDIDAAGLPEDGADNDDK